MEFLRMKVVVFLLFLVAAPLCSSARVLVENEFCNVLGKKWDFDGKLKNSVADDLRLPCEESENEIILSATGDMSVMTFRFNENRARDVSEDGSGEAGKLVYNVLPKGPVAPSGPSRGQN